MNALIKIVVCDSCNNIYRLVNVENFQGPDTKAPCPVCKDTEGEIYYILAKEKQ